MMVRSHPQQPFLVNPIQTEGGGGGGAFGACAKFEDV